MPPTVTTGKPQGFIVLNEGGLCLDQFFHWRQKRTLEEAYVHSAHVLAEGGKWARKARTVIPAQYNPAADFTELIDEQPMAYTKYLSQALNPDRRADSDQIFFSPCN